MKLLLDEMYDPDIARLLREEGHDVEAVAGSSDAGASDSQVPMMAASQERALVTNNVRDFMPIHGQCLQAGESHSGLVFTDDRSMPRHKGATGLFAQALATLLTDRPTANALRDSIAWLP